MVSLKKYQTYESFRAVEDAWLNSLPADWKLTRLQFGSSIRNSGVDKKIVEGEELIKLCNYVDVYYHDIIDDSIDFMEASATPEEIENFRLRKGDVIMTKDSESPDDIGIPAYVSKDFDDIICGYHLCVLKTFRDKIEPKFLFYFLKSTFAQSKFEIYSNGVTRFGLSYNGIKTLPVPVPSLKEQGFIANFLDQKTKQVDDLIEQKEKLLKLLTEKRTATITQAVTKGLDPKVKMKDSGIEWLGQVPEHWQVCLLKYKCKISYGIGGEIDRTLKDGVPLLSLPNINKDGTFNMGEVAFAEVSDREKELLKLENGDLLFNWRNGSSDHLGKTAFFDLDGEYLHVSFLLKLRFEKSKDNSRFYQYALNGFQITGFFASSKAGVNNTFNLSELSNLWVSVPPKHEQDEIASFIRERTIKIDEAIKVITRSINHLYEYRTSLVTSVVTGQIDVRKELVV